MSEFYTLFGMELLINSGVLFARYDVYRDLNKANDALDDGKKKAVIAMEEKRRSTMMRA